MSTKPSYIFQRCILGGPHVWLLHSHYLVIFLFLEIFLGGCTCWRFLPFYFWSLSWSAHVWELLFSLLGFVVNIFFLVEYSIQLACCTFIHGAVAHLHMTIVDHLLFLGEVVMEHSPRKIIMLFYYSYLLEGLLTELFQVDLEAHFNMLWLFCYILRACIPTTQRAHSMWTPSILTWYCTYFYWCIAFSFLQLDKPT